MIATRHHDPRAADPVRSLLRVLLFCGTVPVLAATAIAAKRHEEGVDDNATASKGRRTQVVTDVSFGVEIGNSHTNRHNTLSIGTSEPLILGAGVPYTNVTVTLTGTVPDPAKALFALVPNWVTTADAAAGECGRSKITDGGWALVGAQTGGLFSADAVSSAGNGIVWGFFKGVRNFVSATHRRRNAFQVGGFYRVCYSDTGSWDNGTLVPAEYSSVAVYGALPWRDAFPMKQKRFYCFAGGIPGTNCKVKLEGVLGDTSQQGDWTRFNKLTWAGMVGWEDLCGQGNPIDNIGMGRSDSPYLLGGLGGLVFDLGYTSTRWVHTKYWLCYCPAYDGDGDGNPCNNKADFLQAVGILVIFSTSQSVASIAPATSFDLIIKCGAVNGCSRSFDNRIKIVDPISSNPQENTNNWPNWDPFSGCGLSMQSVHYVRPPNCVSATECSGLVNGGDAMDFKVFRALMMDNKIVAGLTEDREFDVCFCNEQCNVRSNWFKVGIVEIVKTLSLPTTAAGGAYPELSVVNTPGLVHLGTIPNDYPDGFDGKSNSLRNAGQMKLLADDSQQITDKSCARQRPSAAFMNHRCFTPDLCYPRAWKNTTSHAVTFNGKFYYGGLPGPAFPDDPLIRDSGLTTSTSEAGLYAVCYCQSECQIEASWAKLTRLEIRGPRGGQQWSFQSMIPFSLNVKGTGLRSDNRIKITTSYKPCNSDEAPNWEQLHVRKRFAPFFNATVLTDSSPVWELSSGASDGNPIVSFEDYYSQASILTFKYQAKTVGITSLIKAGDTIVISNTTVQRDGVYPYVHPAEPKHVQRIEVPWGHKISYAVQSDATNTKFVFPGVFRHQDGSIPTWSSRMRATWTRTSEQEYEDVESLSAQTGLRVCWSDGGTEDADFVAEVGTLDLTDAPLMAYSTASVAASAAGVVAPIIIAFKTSLESQVRYSQAPNSMSLRIVVPSPYIIPHAADVNASGLVDSTEYNDIGRESQVVCSTLFLELWSSHVNGFPVPKGCYYRHDDRNYVIIFEPKNGLAHSSDYQIVMNVQTQLPPEGASHWDQEPAIRLWSMDDMILRREFAVEVGVCYLSPGKRPTAPATVNESRLVDAGFKIFGNTGTHEYVDLSQMGNNLMFELHTLPNETIQRGSHLRVILFPLTTWHLETGCQVQCEYEDPSQSVCGSPGTDEAICVPEGVYSRDGAHQNVAHIVFPYSMSRGNTSGALQVNISHLLLPAHGFFPVRLAAELTPDGVSRPEYRRSVGKLVYVPPDIKFAALVSSAVGDGDDKPYRGDRSNTLYMRFVLGATLRSQRALQEGERIAKFAIKLPDMYACVAVSPVPETLKVFGSDWPQGRGDLPSSTESGPVGSWNLEDDRCHFRISPSLALYAGQSFFLRLVVDNPPYVLKSGDPRNVWRMELASFGDLQTSTKAVRAPSRVFRGGGDGYFSNNVAVQGRLTANLAPTEFARGSTTNHIYVFFHTEQGAGQRAQVRVLGPVDVPFDFSRRCDVGFLPGQYYVTVSPYPPTHPLPGMARQVGCEGIQSMVRPSRHYGALIRLSGRLRAARHYGFSILVRNPDEFDMTQTQQWRVQTATTVGEEVDGTHSTTPLNPRQTSYMSFGMYAYQPPASEVVDRFVVALGSNLPYVVTGATTSVAIGGITFPTDASCQLRVIAPALYEWSYLPRDFLYRPVEVAPLLPNDGLLSDGTSMVDTALPVGYMAPPLVEPLNEIASARAANFAPLKRYGLAARVVIPNSPVVHSANAFFVQCGHAENQLTNRPFAGVLQAPPVAILVDAAVGYHTNIVGMRNRLSFQVRTITALQNTGALIIKGPPGFKPEATQCSIFAVTGGLDDRRQELRDAYLNYEEMLRKADLLQDGGANQNEVDSIKEQIDIMQRALKAQVFSVWVDNKRANNLPLDTGCRFEQETQVLPFVQIVLQLGAPNSDVDGRLASYARREHPELFEAETRTESALMPGLYRFALDVTNPDDLRGNPPRDIPEIQTVVGPNAGAGTPPKAPEGCGYAQCWEIITYAAPFDSKVTADQARTTKGFPMVQPMKAAQHLSLTPAQRRAIRRNDRPGEPNQIIIMFELTRVLPETVQVVEVEQVEQTLAIRAPAGFEFAEDCIVYTSRNDVFGSPELWPEDLNLTNWTESTGTVSRCEGVDNIATMFVVGSAGLQPHRRYAIRLDGLSNPLQTPVQNMWTVEFQGQVVPGTEDRHSESSHPFMGYELWTFGEAKIVPQTLERSSGVSTDPNGGITKNMVTLMFIPHSSILAPGGVLKVRAPDNFKWFASTSQHDSDSSNLSIAAMDGTAPLPCAADLRVRPAQLSDGARAAMASGSLATSFWEKVPVACAIDSYFPNVFVVMLIGTKGLVALERYALIIHVINPTFETSEAGFFELSSYSPAEALGPSSSGPVDVVVATMDSFDIAEVLGFLVTKGLSTFEIKPETGVAARGGLVAVARVVAAFVEPIFPGDVLLFSAPPGYNLRATSTALGSNSKKCLRILNRARPGAFPDHNLRCFHGLACRLEVAGRALQVNSHVQLHRLDRPCGDAPGRDVESRRTMAEPSHMGVSKAYNLGVGLAVDVYRVCYCHGDDGCTKHSNFCQEVGNLTVIDLCAGVTCVGTTSPCERRCDPRTGLCRPQTQQPFQSPDGFPCDNATSVVGHCRDGFCSPGPAPSHVQAAPIHLPANGTSATSDDADDFQMISSAWSCAVDRFECDNRSLTWIVGHQGYERDFSVHFDVTMMHPVSSPREDDFFVIRHKRNDIVRSSSVTQSYAIEPEFRHVSVELVGHLKAGGSVSAIRLDLVAVSPASSLWLRAKAPIGFDFQDATVPPDVQIISAKGDAIEFAGHISPSSPLSVYIDGVRLPLQGGQTTFDIISFNGTLVRDSTYDVEGFRVPVHIDISEPVLLNQFKRDQTGAFRTEAAFGNRLGEWAQLRLRFELSGTLYAPLRLRLHAASWRVSPLSTAILQQQASEETKSLNYSLTSFASFDDYGTADAVDIILHHDLYVNTVGSYYMMVDVFAPQPEDCACWVSGVCRLCNANWTLEAKDNMEMPLGTNDGLLVGFPLVAEVAFSMFASRPPPGGQIDLTLRLTRVGVVPPTMLIVTAPVRYRFPYQCSAGTWTANVTSSDLMPVFESCVGRVNVAILRLDERGLMRPTTIVVQVSMPHVTPEDNRWYLEGRQIDGNTQVAWGVTTGPDTVRWQTVSVQYAHFALARIFFLVQFAADVGVAAGGSVIVLPPSGYMLSCSGFIPYELPSSISVSASESSSCTQQKQGIGIRFSLPLRAQDSQSFIIEGETGRASTNQASSGPFWVQLVNKEGRVVEASYDVPALSLRTFGAVESPFLTWYPQPAVGAKVWVTVGFHVPLRGPTGLEAVRVTMPRGFRHEVLSTSKETSSDGLSLVWFLTTESERLPGTFSDYKEWSIVSTTEEGNSLFAVAGANNVTLDESLGNPFPIIADSRRWLALGKRDQMEIRLEPRRAFPACEVFMRFPVTLPSTLPTENVWRLSFIMESDGSEGPGAFVIPGFDFGASPPADHQLDAEHVFQANGLDYFEFAPELASNGERARSSFVLTFGIAFGSIALRAVRLPDIGADGCG